MNVEIAVTKRNRIFLYFLILLVFPIVYNKLGYKLTWNNLEMLSFGFLMLCLIMSVYLFGCVVMICAMRRVFAGALDAPVSKWKGILGKFGYFVSAIVPSIFVLLAFLSIWIWHREEFWDMLWMNSIWRVSFICLVLVGLSLLIAKNRAWALFFLEKEIVEVIKEVIVEQEVIKEVIVKEEVIKEVIVEREVIKEVIKEVEKVVEVPVATHDASGLPNKIALNEMYSYLVHVAGVGPKILNKLIRFFDIVAIRTGSGVRHVIFSDGTVVRCDQILSVFEALNLDGWMVKISDSYMVNMLLVDFPDFKDGKQLKLHMETMEGLLRNMKLADIQLMLVRGAGIKDKYILEFLKTKNSLTHVGWDTWVPFKK
ncbi:hypothetical protein ACFX5U_16055 [Sphingobacterium sp. SG20118]|uniref:hypothetical protein n=1 Tax=Sphingobacterium sp. SG20118 TaxID=3367156 RepID=UPI0037DFC766